MFLTPTSSRSGDWNPFLIGLAGLKVSHPFRSSPQILRARDDDWKKAADELIRHAHIVVLDDSEGSDAIRAEVAMLTDTDRWAQTLIITEACRSRADVQSFPEAREKALRVSYKRSWVRALPRMILGLIAVMVVWPLAWGFSGYLMAAFTMAAAAQGYDLEPMIGEYRTVIPLTLLILFPYAYHSFFVRPSIDQALGRSLLSRLGRQP